MKKTKLRLAAVAALLLATACQHSPPTEAVHVRQMAIEGTQLAYVDEGHGPAVVFVHGAAGDWRSWEGLRPIVAQRYRYVALSRRYHHPNAWADEGGKYSMEQHAEDVAAFVHGLGAGKVHLVGNSYGGRVVGLVALEHPELLRSVVIGEASLAPPTSAEGKAAAIAFSAELGKSAAAAKAGDNRQSAILLANAVLDDPAGFEKLSTVRRERWLDNDRTMGPMYAAPMALAVRCEQLGALAVPALVVRGEHTRANYRHGHEAVLACLPPGTAQFVVPDSRHPWQADNPDAAARGLLAFFDRH